MWTFREIIATFRDAKKCRSCVRFRNAVVNFSVISGRGNKNCRKLSLFSVGGKKPNRKQIDLISTQWPCCPLSPVYSGARAKDKLAWNRCRGHFDRFKKARLIIDETSRQIYIHYAISYVVLWLLMMRNVLLRNLWTFSWAEVQYLLRNWHLGVGEASPSNQLDARNFTFFCKLTKCIRVVRWQYGLFLLQFVIYCLETCKRYPDTW